MHSGYRSSFSWRERIRNDNHRTKRTIGHFGSAYVDTTATIPTCKFCMECRWEVLLSFMRYNRRLPSMSKGLSPMVHTVTFMNLSYRSPDSIYIPAYIQRMGLQLVDWWVGYELEDSPPPKRSLQHSLFHILLSMETKTQSRRYHLRLNSPKTILKQWHIIIAEVMIYPTMKKCTHAFSLLSMLCKNKKNGSSIFLAPNKRDENPKEIFTPTRQVETNWL